MLRRLVEQQARELEHERPLHREQVLQEERGLVGAQGVQQHPQDGGQEAVGVVPVAHHLHDDLEGVQDDHAGLGGQDALDVGVRLRVNDALSAGLVERQGVGGGAWEVGLEEGGLVPPPTAGVGIGGGRQHSL